MDLTIKTYGDLVVITPPADADRSIFFHVYVTPDGVDITDVSCEGELAVSTLLEAIKLANEIYEGFQSDER